MVVLNRFTKITVVDVVGWGGGGAQQMRTSLNFDRLCSFYPILYQNAFKNKAQMAKESMYSTSQKKRLN